MRNFIIIALILSAVNAGAQKPYFKVGVGLASPDGGALQNSSGLPLDGTYSGVSIPSNTSESFEMTPASYTTGVQAVLGAGLMLKKNVGFELGATICALTKIHKSDFYYEYSGGKEHGTITSQSDMPVTLTPSVVVQTGGKWNIYCRGGLAVPVKKNVVENIDYTRETFNQATNSYVVMNVKRTDEYKMRLNTGFAGAVGVKYKATKKLVVWGEAGLLYMNLYQKESMLTAYSENGVSLLSQIPSSQRITEYELKASSSGTASNIAPAAQMQFSNFNITLGVEVDLR